MTDEPQAMVAGEIRSDRAAPAAWRDGVCHEGYAPFADPTGGARARDRCVHELFEGQAARSPHAVAVTCDGHDLSYEALNIRANQLAHDLIRRGVRPDTVVALCLGRSSRMLVALLAVFKAGAAYVPLDPEHPVERLRYMLDDTAAAVLLTERGLRGRLPFGHLDVVSLDEDWERIASHSRSNPRVGLHPDHLAYCVYTSGSTGKPKPVGVPHSALANHSVHMARELGIRSADRVLQFTSITIDACLEEIFPTWLGGATLVVQSTRMQATGDFARTLQQQRVSVLSLPTSYWHYWVDELSRAPETWPGTLRLVFVGGEKVLSEKLRRWQEIPCTRGVDWILDYGPCEATISCTTFSPEQASGRGAVPIGRPISNVQVLILDAHGSQVPAGVVGELHIAGRGLARGYLNRPGLTAEAFVPNPFGDPGGRMYRTGDLGRHLPDGNIEFVGRADHQVKILGRRIELGEIETALLQCPGVRDAVVVLCDEESTGKRLAAYVVTDVFDEDALRRRLAQTLPALMVPADLVPLAELPLSPFTGKVDRTRLPVPDGRAPRDPLADLSELEQEIARAWTDAAGRPPQSATDDFFTCGGDSLRAVRLLGRLSSLTGCALTFADFSAGRTIPFLARALLRKARERDPVAADLDLEQGLARRLRDGVPARGSRLSRREETRRPASRGQQRLWFLRRMQEAAAYSVPLAYRIRGAFSVGQLDRALTTIVARHEAVRTALVMDEGQLWQQIAPPMPIRTREVDVAGLDEAVAGATAAASVPFDLGQPPLFSSWSFRCGPEDTLLMFNMDHAVCDAWSLGIFWRELTALYGAADGSEPGLEPPGFQQADFTDWHREWLESPLAERQRDYWRDALAGELPRLGLGQALSRGVRSERGALAPWRADPELRQAIRRTADALGTTDFVIVLSAFVATLHRYTRDEQIVIGVPAACRSLPETDGIVGYLSNTLPVRVWITPGLRGSDLVRRTSSALSEAMGHQELPFDEIVDLLNIPRQTGVNPIFQAMFVMQSTPADDPLRLGTAKVEEVVIHAGTSKVDLTCTMRAAPDGWVGELEYSLDVFDSTAAARFVDGFGHLLAELTSRPSARLDEWSLVSAGERQRLVAAARSRFEVYEPFHPITARVEAQARLTPDAIAIEAGGQRLRYDELNGRANRLARRLIEAGARPEQLVGVCLDRSMALVVAVLATLKAGAAFVPLDPRFPVERIRQICRDASAALVITQRRYLDLVKDARVSLVVDEGSADGAATENPAITVPPGQTAYVYYTSGSTGVPKGVVVDHACAMNRLEWLRRRYPLSRGDRVLHKTPLIFDVAIWEIFGPLCAGATILMADPDHESDAWHIRSLLVREGTVFTHFVPSMLDAYLSVVPETSYPYLRWVSLSGEAVSSRLFDACRRHFSTEVHNLYGQTETSEVAGWERSHRHSAGVPIGRQIGIYRLHVLDGCLNPVPPGVPGEICVAGAGGLARGYHARPELTAEAFVPNPFAIVPGERLYRTGDLARLSEDGVIEYVGRVDHQVKVRGCRVETAEVEAVLARHPGVTACAVDLRAEVRREMEGDRQLVAYVVSDRVSASELGTHAERFLPAYMLPAAYVFVRDLPLTPSGKLDRLKLPAPTASDFEARGQGQGARTPLEAALIALWMQVLGLHRVGRTDNFFVIGGNSLKCIQVLSRTNATYGVEVSVREFFDSPTVEGLASAIERRLLAMVTSLSDVEVNRCLEQLSGCQRNND